MLSAKTTTACATSTRLSMRFRPCTKIQPGAAGWLAGGSTTFPRKVPSTAESSRLDNNSASTRNVIQPFFILYCDAKLPVNVLCRGRQPCNMKQWVSQRERHDSASSWRGRGSLPAEPLNKINGKEDGHAPRNPGGRRCGRPDWRRTGQSR